MVSGMSMTNVCKWLAVLAMTTLVAACVTTEKGVFTEKKDKEKALEYSVQLARGYVQQRNWDMAKHHLKRAMEIDKNDPSVHETLALVFQNTGELELAEQEYKSALRLKSDDSRIRFNYGLFLMSQKRYEDAEKAFAKVTDDLLYERRDSAFTNLGTARVALGKFELAEDAFRRAWLMDRSNAATSFELASVLYTLGKYGEAQQHYEFYRSQAKRQSARGLWLGLRLADQFKDYNARDSYALALKNLYPHSKEYLAYLSIYGK